MIFNDELVLLDELSNVRPEMINNDGSFHFFERVLVRDQQIRIFVHSNEVCGHSRPHVHATYDHYEYQISIDDPIEILRADGPDRYGLFLIKGYFSPSKIQDFRKAWNGIKSDYKFIEANGKFVMPSL